jgi:hypothetical protein
MIRPRDADSLAIQSAPHFGWQDVLLKVDRSSHEFVRLDAAASQPTELNLK